MKNFFKSNYSLKLSFGLILLSLLLSLLPISEEKYFPTSLQHSELIDKLKPPSYYSIISLQKIFFQGVSNPSLIFLFEKEILQLVFQEKRNLAFAEKNLIVQNFNNNSFFFFKIFYLKKSFKELPILG